MSMSPKDVVSYLEALKEGATPEEQAMLDVARAAVLEMVEPERPTYAVTAKRSKAETLVKANVRQEVLPWHTETDHE